MTWTTSTATCWASVWRAWADNLRGHALACGHYMAEEAPAELAAALHTALAEPPRA